MNNAILINENLTTTGQISVKQLEQAIQEGYKSVLNLRRRFAACR
ncbi:hypothetical protein [Nostoc sp. LEGE 06077]|nr:hypothetical protein [Nostoc sp. LEGE 06077]